MIPKSKFTPTCSFSEVEFEVKQSVELLGMMITVECVRCTSMLLLYRLQENTEQCAQNSIQHWTVQDDDYRTGQGQNIS